MEPLQAGRIYGNWATLLLPLNEDDSINYHQLEEEIDTLIAYRVDGIYSNGTAGEFYNQTEEEFDQVNTMLAAKCNAAGMRFQVGASHMSPVISRERLKRALLLQPSAIQIILPDWFIPTMPEIIDYLRLMAELAAPVGLVLYNPPHAKKKLLPKDIKEILHAGIPLVGCKMAGGDEAWYKEMSELPVPFSVFIPGHHLATGISRGAHGAYSNVACLNPRFSQMWYDSIVRGEPSAFELETRIQRFMNDCIVPYITEQGFSNQAVDKLMAAVGGWAPVSPRLRWPYQWIPVEDVLTIRRKCEEILPEVFYK